MRTFRADGTLSSGLLAFACALALVAPLAPNSLTVLRVGASAK